MVNSWAKSAALAAVLWAGVGLCTGAAQVAASGPMSLPTSSQAASSPATAPTEFGPSVAGLAAGAALDGAVVFGGRQEYVLALRNKATHAVPMGTSKDAFAWLLIAQGKDAAYFSDRVPLGALASEWPKELTANTTIALAPAILTNASAYRYEKGLKVINGFPAGADGLPPKPAGKLEELLTLGKAKAKWMVYLPATDGRAEMLLASNSIDLVVEAPRLADLSASAKAALRAELLRQFDRDEWSAKQAHDQAVKLGKDILPDLIEAVNQKDRPEHARLWLAAAIAELPAKEAVASLSDLLDDPSEGVRCVVAYYGPKQDSKELDKAILQKAQANPSDRFTSYTLLGYMVFRSHVPEELLKAGLDSDDPRARATAAQTLAGMASDFNKTRLGTLLADKDPRVRAAAQKILDAMKTADKP